MNTGRVRLVVMATLVLAAPAASHRTTELAAQERPLPAADAFYASVRANLARSDREQYKYAYHERRSEVHTNPFGKLGTESTVLYQIVPGEESGLYSRRLLERDGKPVAGEKPEPVDRRSRTEGNPAIDDVMATLDFKLAGRERLDGHDVVAVRFTPKADARPKTRQGRIAKVFKGTVWVDEQAHEVVRLEAIAIDSLSYGLGVLARLSEGTKVKVLRAPIDAVWLPTSIRLTGEGRALLFRKLDIDYFIEWFDYKRALP